MVRSGSGLWMVCLGRDAWMVSSDYMLTGCTFLLNKKHMIHGL